MAQANDRTSRDADIRENFQRQQEWKPASALPDFNKVPGWAYRWVRTSMAGQADAMNVSSKMHEGWEPVRLSDHPEMHLYADAATRYKDCIEVGGLMLCKIPEEFISQRNAFFSKITQAQTEAVDNSFMKHSNPHMPLFAEKRSDTSFGKGK